MSDSANHRLAVAAVVRRYLRRTGCVIPITYGDIYADAITRLSGDSVNLDGTERALVHLKRRGIISGRRMVSLLARHLRETKG